MIISFKVILIYVNDRYALKTIDGGEFTGILLCPILVNFFFSENIYNTEPKTTEKPFVAILLNLTGFCAFPYRTIIVYTCCMNMYHDIDLSHAYIITYTLG